MHLKRLFLLGFLFSMLLTALVAIGVLLFGKFGGFEIKVLVSSLSIGVYALIALACSTVDEEPSLRWLSRLGILMCVVGLTFALITNWQLLQFSIETIAKFRFIFLNFSIAICATALTLRTSSSSGFVRICQLLTVVCILISSTIVTVILMYPNVFSVASLAITKILSTSVILSLLGIVVTSVLVKSQGINISSPLRTSFDFKAPTLGVILLLLGVGFFVQQKIKNTPPNPFDPMVSRQSLLPVVDDPRLDPNMLGPEKTTILYELACDNLSTNYQKNKVLLSLINNSKTNINWTPTDYEAKIRFSNREGIAPTPIVCIFDYIGDEIFARFLSDDRLRLDSDQINLILSKRSLSKIPAKERFEKILAAKKVDLDQQLQGGGFLLDSANRFKVDQSIIELLRRYGATKQLDPITADTSSSAIPIAMHSPVPTPTSSPQKGQQRNPHIGSRMPARPASSLAIVQNDPLYQAFLQRKYTCHILPNVHGYTQLYINGSFRGNFTDQDGTVLLSRLPDYVKKGICKLNAH